MTVEQRLERLERQNQYLQAGGIAVLLASMAIITMGATQSIPDVVTARAFHVVGNDGAVIVKLGDTFGNGTGSAGMITTLNDKGQKLVKLTSTINGEGVVATHNGKGQNLVKLTVTTTGEGAVTTLNGNGHDIVTLGASTEGEGMVTTLDGKGHDLVKLGARSDGPGAVVTFDPRKIETMGSLTTLP